MGVLAVGALAVGVSVYAAPRANGTAPGKSNASRLVTGATQHLQAVVDGRVAGGGTYVGIKSRSDTQDLDGSDARLYFEYQLGGWGGELETFQITVDPATLCNGKGACFTKPLEACTEDDECEALFFLGSKCNLGICEVAYQDVTNPDMPLNPGINACSSVNLVCGSTKIPAIGSTQDDGRKWYGGELVLDLIGGRGTYDICPEGGAASFLVLDGAVDIAISQFNCANVTVPQLRCCELASGGCTPSTTREECDAIGGLQLSGTCEDPCIECTEPGDGTDCPSDGDACTIERCTPLLTCEHPPIPGFDPATDCCDPGNASIVPREDDDDCTDDECSLGGSSGVPVHDCSSPGTGCDDGNACTFDDICDGACGCGGTDANDVACQTDDDCLLATGGALECQDDKTCFCTLSPNISFVIDPSGHPGGDDNCFEDDAKVFATVHVGPSLDVIVGGEIAVVYDASCMVLNGVVTIAPFDNILFLDTDTPGSIYIAVGIDLGGVGVGGGNFDLLALSFTKQGGCAGCQLCFTDDNPRHTRLTSDAGQAVTTQPKCSKDIRGNGVLTIDTPPGGKFNTECDKPARDVTWDNPTASDTCEVTEFACSGFWQNPYTGEVVPVGDIGVDPYKGGRFPIGSATFCCNAENQCGDNLRDCWTVDVNDQTTLDVDIQLSPTMAGQPGDDALTRCIKFEVFTGCTNAPLVFQDNVSFGGLFELVGKSQASIKIPITRQFDCITARDQLHTLRSCYIFQDGDCDADGRLHATFKGDPFFGGNWLVGGNLDGFKKESATASLDAIDITDFGMFVSQYPGVIDPNTPCKTAGPHSDINGDGLIDLLDFTFISMNFLKDSKDCCCPGSAATAPSGRTEISVAEARKHGQPEVAAADLNNDGVVNLTDMSLFLGGQTPVKKGQIRSRTGALR
jgi:hypothetical protein